nr:hypothetical protein OHA15_33530 [Streptomyces anthocyanicus]
MSDRAELLKLHDWDELLFGGFYCLHCSPTGEDSFDDPIAWPCPPLREAGLTDDEAREIIVARREKVEADYRAKKVSEQAEAQRRINDFNHRHPVGTLVFAYPGVRPEDGTGTRLVTRTRTDAQLSASAERLQLLLAHPETAAVPASAGEQAEQRHWLYDADPDATTPAFPYPTAQEA